jgi:hypothetical protein
MRPVLFTFDIVGTLSDWRRGLQQDLARLGRSLGAELGSWPPYPDAAAGLAALRALAPCVAMANRDRRPAARVQSQDLAAAVSLGLSTAFVKRPRWRPGTASATVLELVELAPLARGAG